MRSGNGIKEAGKSRKEKFLMSLSKRRDTTEVMPDGSSAPSKSREERTQLQLAFGMATSDIGALIRESTHLGSNRLSKWMITRKINKKNYLG